MVIKSKLSRGGAGNARLLSRPELTTARYARGTVYACILMPLANLLDRCIPRMDHHCPWTVNCVSHRTFPHFYRFLLYSGAAMIYLQNLILIRAWTLWEGRNRPSHLGPSAVQLISLFILLLTNSVTLLAIGLLLARNTWILGANVTTIEGWEIERHKTLVRRARGRGGYLDGPDGAKVKLTKQEFPYDIGIMRNISQGMGGPPLSWLWPLARTPSNDSGLAFETNEFSGALWPPPDPDKMPRRRFSYQDRTAFTRDLDGMTTQEQVVAFHRRQEEDLKRFDGGASSAIRPPVAGRQGTESNQTRNLGGHVWRNPEGETLDNFGVDQDVDFYDEDDIPLGELKERKRIPRAR
ncbi:MAG: hypothetical protein Q9217_001852 [Psora testacea]